MNGQESQEALELQEADLEGLEATETEVEAEIARAESVEMEASPEALAESVLEGEEGTEAGGQEFIGAVAGFAGKALLKKLLAIVIQYVKAVIKQLIARGKRDLIRKACKRGPKGICKLIAPAVCKALPRPFRFLCRRLLPLACRALHGWICRQVGATKKEMEMAEFEF